MIKKIRTSKIVLLLLDPSALLYGSFGPREAMEAGQMLHYRFGYGDSDTYRRMYEHAGEIYQILGTPDKIVHSEKCIEEFKTYTRRGKLSQIKRARLQIQIYGWLTNLRKGRIILFNRDTENSENIDLDLSPEVAEKIIAEGLCRYSLLKSLKPLQEELFQSPSVE